MRLLVVAVGRAKAGPEAELCRRYLDRADKAGRALGLRLAETVLEESRAGEPARRRAEEAAAIRRARAGRLVLFDERGEALSSPAFAAMLGAWKDGGAGAATLVVGGPDGLDASLSGEADRILSFGAMTLPHQLARVLVLEQVYRAATILSGHPYHRA